MSQQRNSNMSLHCTTSKQWQLDFSSPILQTSKLLGFLITGQVGSPSIASLQNSDMSLHCTDNIRT